MKMKLNQILMLLIAGVATSTPAADKLPVTANATNYFTITGMHCIGCANGLTAELKETKGVLGAGVSFSNKLAVVAFDTNKITTTKLMKVIKEAGFEASQTKSP